MKKIFPVYLSMLLIAIINPVSAQFFVGGSISGGISTSDLSNSIYANMRPYAGFFISDNFALGGELILNYSQINNKTTDTESNNIGIGLAGFARKYFSQNEKIRFFVHAYGDLYYSNDNNTAEMVLGIGARPAIEFSLSEKLKLNIMAGIMGIDLISNETANKEIDLFFSLNSLSFGLNYEL